MKKILVFWFLCLHLVLATNSSSSAQDSLRVLSAEEVLNIVRKYHPIIKKTTIEIEKSRADITVSRAQFDPFLSAEIGEKVFKNEKYYEYFSPEISVPTWYGIDFVGGIDNLSGSHTDPTQSLGKTSFLGVNIPLAKNLLFDKRRAALQQAKIFNTMAEVEQRAIINDLMFEAISVYWEWVRAYQTYSVVKTNVDVNRKRVELIKKSFKNGERAAIDTVEAVAQWQSFMYQQNQHWFEFQKAGLNLSAYLWRANDEPYLLPESVIPSATWENELIMSNFNLNFAELYNLSLSTHPDLRLYGYKLDVLEIDRKAKFQDLLPKINFKYNFLNKGYSPFSSIVDNRLFGNNYTYGLKIEMPLRLSQGRGDYRKAKLKIQETSLDQKIKRQAVELKVRNYYNEFQTLRQQIALQSANLSNYQQLVRAEEIKLLNGESSLFLINSRENKALDALEKLVELKTKYYKTIYALQWSAGLLQ